MQPLAYGLLFLGLVFVFLEVMFPSAGILTILAIAALVGGGWLSAMETGGIPVGYVITCLIAIPATFVGAIKVFPRTPWGRRFILSGPTFAGDEGRQAVEHVAELVGQEGVATTTLRPSGVARIGERRVDVVTRGEMIPSGTAIRVLEVSGNRVVVESSQA